MRGSGLTRSHLRDLPEQIVGRIGRRCWPRPRPVPAAIRSLTADGHWVFIEVKGRILGAGDFVVTRHEVL
jgi:hypothetical protein